MGLDETVALRYPPPAYITDVLEFGLGNQSKDVDFLWVGDELTPREVQDRANDLMAINMKLSSDDIL